MVKHNNKDNRKFWKHYRIFIIVMLIVIFSIWSLLWSYLYFYEKSRPEYEVDKISQLFKKGKVDKIIKYVDVKGKYNTKESLKKIMKENLKKSSISYEKKRGEFKNEMPVYSILNDGKEIAVIRLKQSSKREMFNTVNWKIDNIEYNSLKETIEIVALPNEKVTINGIEVSKEEITDDNYIPKQLNNVLKYVDYSPLVKYEIDDVYQNSVVDFEKSSFKKEDNVYTYSYPSDEKLLEEHKEFLTNWCKNYTKYVVNETNFGSISSFVIQSSNAYSFLRTVANTNIWLAAHTPTEFSGFTFDNMQKYQDDLYSVDIKYDYSFYVSGDLKEYQTSLSLYLIEVDGKWLIADLTI